MKEHTEWGEHGDQPETWEDECKDVCPGLFVDGDTLAVTRCDTCARFETDEDAAELVNALLDAFLPYAKSSATLADALHRALQALKEGEKAHE